MKPIKSGYIAVIARSEATKQSIHSFRLDGLLRGARHRARIRAMAWQGRRRIKAKHHYPLRSLRRGVKPLQESGSAPRSRTQRTSVWLVFGLDAKRAEPNFQDELPTAAAPEILIVSMPPLPRAACDIKDDDRSNHKGDDKNGNRMIHRNLPCCVGPRCKGVAVKVKRVTISGPWRSYWRPDGGRAFAL